MNTETLSACLQYQERGAFWYGQASMWQQELAGRHFARASIRDEMRRHALDDQSFAAKLSKADRVLRGVGE